MRNVMRHMAVVLLAAFCQTAWCAGGTGRTQPAAKKESKALVVYFSATGNTRDVAMRLAKTAGADLMEITPQQPYTSADLDWHDKQSRTTIEMHDAKARPAMKKTRKNLAAYKVIYLGYPIWWNTAPRIINTFVEAYNLTGKTVVTFATAGGAGIENSEKDLRTAYPKVNWKHGAILKTPTEADLKALVVR